MGNHGFSTSFSMLTLGYIGKNDDKSRWIWKVLDCQLVLDGRPWILLLCGAFTIGFGGDYPIFGECSTQLMAFTKEGKALNHWILCPIFGPTQPKKECEGSINATTDISNKYLECEATTVNPKSGNRANKHGDSSLTPG